MYELKPNQDSSALFFGMQGELAERHGVIGHLRADFGAGCEFWSTWFDNQTHLKSLAFKNELDAVFTSLRNDGKAPPFANRKNLSSFCCTTPGMTFPNQGDGYMVQTLDYLYCFRCKPRRGEYDIYCFAYDNRFLLPELDGKHELPHRCYAVLPSTGELILIIAGEKGYRTIKDTHSERDINRKVATASNDLWGITRAQEEAMLAGSLFGWDTPAAKPWIYDRDGKPLPARPRKDAPER